MRRALAQASIHSVQPAADSLGAVEREDPGQPAYRAARCAWPPRRAARGRARRRRRRPATAAVLGLEVVEDQAGADAEPAGDVGDPGAREAALGHLVDRGAQDLLAPHLDLAPGHARTLVRPLVAVALLVTGGSHDDRRAGRHRRSRVGAAAVRREHDAARPRRTRRRPCWLGSGGTSSPAPGCASAGSPTLLPDGTHAGGVHRRGRVRSCCRATRRAPCGRSPTPAGTAVTSCSPRASTSGKRALVCPYHAWSYDLDGCLIAAPGFRDVATFDPAQHGLVQLPVEVWHGWVFVNATGGAGDAVRRPHWRAGRPRRAVRPGDGSSCARRTTTSCAANWKVVTENYHECYHCPLIHPELCQVSPPSSGANFDLPGAWVGGSMDLRDERGHDVARRTFRGRPIDGADPRQVLYLGPAAQPAAVAAPGLRDDAPDDAAVARARPGSSAPGTSRTLTSTRRTPSSSGTATNRQDWAACESVQRGLASPHFAPGPLAPNEDAVHKFVTAIARATATARCRSSGRPVGGRPRAGARRPRRARPRRRAAPSRRRPRAASGCPAPCRGRRAGRR